MYDIKQAGRIWGLLGVKTLIKWGFKNPSTDERTLCFVEESNFVFFCIVVNDPAFALHNEHLLHVFKDKISGTFDVKFYGELKKFIG